MIKYIGVNDHNIDLFEGQYDVENGMSYNSYLIDDEKIAIIDTVDANFKEEWLNNVLKELNGKVPSYLIVQHMEPDHSSAIDLLVSKYPDIKIYATVGAYNMMKNLFGTDFPNNKNIVKDGDTLSLGHHKLKFITAPLVHWPEVMFTYDESENSLFSADAFGKFGALDYDDPVGWACEARRYYFGIVGKFGANVLAALNKLKDSKIEKIYPLHGPILDDNISYYINTYKTWASYNPEDSGVTICYTSVYGSTKKASEILAKELENRNIKASLFDLARDDMAEALEDAFRYDRLVLATTTYNGDIFPFMKTFIDHLNDHNYQNRKIAFIENGMWAPTAAKKMLDYLEGLKDIEFINSKVTIKGSVNDDVIAQIKELAKQL